VSPSWLTAIVYGVRAWITAFVASSDTSVTASSHAPTASRFLNASKTKRRAAETLSVTAGSVTLTAANEPCGCGGGWFGEDLM
jgi:hypothetical protein